MNNTQTIVEKLKLKPHPEGGFYAETYRSSDTLDVSKLAQWQSKQVISRPVSTAIYYLLSKSDFSALHRIKSDECWHHYSGEAFEIIEITPSGELKKTVLGSRLAEGQIPQYVVPAGNWFASRLYRQDAEYGLVGCTVSPGFDFSDFVMARRADLKAKFPKHAALIDALTRG